MEKYLFLIFIYKYSQKQVYEFTLDFLIFTLWPLT